MHLFTNFDLVDVGSITIKLSGEEEVVFNVDKQERASKKGKFVLPNNFTKTNTIINH